MDVSSLTGTRFKHELSGPMMREATLQSTLSIASARAQARVLVLGAERIVPLLCAHLAGAGVHFFLISQLGPLTAAELVSTSSVYTDIGYTVSRTTAHLVQKVQPEARVDALSQWSLEQFKEHHYQSYFDIAVLLGSVQEVRSQFNAVPANAPVLPVLDHDHFFSIGPVLNTQDHYGHLPACFSCTVQQLPSVNRGIPAGYARSNCDLLQVSLSSQKILAFFDAPQGLNQQLLVDKFDLQVRAREVIPRADCGCQLQQARVAQEQQSALR